MSLRRRLDRLAQHLALRYGPGTLADLEARIAALEARAARGDEDTQARYARVAELFDLARERRHRQRLRTGVKRP